MNNNYVITHMSKDEVLIAIAWAEREGWNPGLHDVDCFYQTDPKGFFAGKLDGKIIAVGSAVIYDDQFAFCGFYMVDPAYRGQGFGMALTKARLKYIGHRNAGLDGVIPMVEKYARLGYTITYNNARYCGVNKSYNMLKNKSLIPLSQVNFEQLVTYDRRYFPARRDTFLACWINQESGKSIGYIHQGELLGYGVIRACKQGFKIGPLFAENAQIADELFIQLATHANGQQVCLDIPECNPFARDLVKRHQLEKVFETARMYLKNAPIVEIEHIYGITSFELG